MKRTSTVRAALCAAVAILCLFAGCGRRDSTPTEPPAPPPVVVPPPHCVLPSAERQKYPDAQLVESLDKDYGVCIFYTTILGAQPNAAAIQPAFEEAVTRYPANLVGPNKNGWIVLVRFTVKADNGKCLLVLPDEWAEIDRNLARFPNAVYDGHACTAGFTQVPRFPIIITVPTDAAALSYEFENAMCYAANSMDACAGAGLLSIRKPSSAF